MRIEKIALSLLIALVCGSVVFAVVHEDGGRQSYADQSGVAMQTQWFVANSDSCSPSDQPPEKLINWLRHNDGGQMSVDDERDRDGGREVHITENETGVNGDAYNSFKEDIVQYEFFTKLHDCEVSIGK